MKPMTPNDLGKIVEHCQKVPISDFLFSYRTKIKELILKNSIEISGHDIELLTSKTGNGGTRYWFKCPICIRRVGILFRHTNGTTGCRICLDLSYRAQRYKG